MKNLLDLEKKINSELTTKVKSSRLNHDQIYLNIEIYFYNKVLSRNNFENDYKSFKQTMNKINNMNKFNLDKDSSLLEIKNTILNER